jgi:hypothetical protein
MREHFAIDPLIGKRQQLLLATQLCRMVLKVRLSFSFRVLSHTDLQLDQQRYHLRRRRVRVLDYSALVLIGDGKRKN